MPLTSLLLLFAGGMLGGVINVMAGGAGFMTFPLLIAAGLTEMQANAANFVALLPANVAGSAVYAKELRDVRQHLILRLMLAVVGGTMGSLLLIWLGEASFHKAIPWLLLFATSSFALGPTLKRWLERNDNFDISRWLWLSFVLEFLVYVYGGYFGLGMGIILLAIHSIFSHMSVHHANALRNITIAAMTLFSILIFAREGLIQWLPSLVMMAGAV
ncbi:MAG: sulfite exporter TauE/SafE family protein, partial [Aestuariivirga sp.]